MNRFEEDEAAYQRERKATDPIVEKSSCAERAAEIVDSMFTSGEPGDPFFIGLRDVGRILENSDPYAARNAMEHLVLHGILTVAVKGKPGSPKATRYRFTI